MRVTKKEVQHIADLARLRIADSDIGLYTDHFNQILDYLDELNQLDTQGVEPMRDVVSMPTPLRQDSVRPSLAIEEVLANAPESFERFFLVPKVVE